MRHSEIRSQAVIYVDLYEDNVLLQTRIVDDKTMLYAEEIAENWDRGLIQLESS